MVQIAAGDLNGDGVPDLVAAWEQGVGTVDQSVEILASNGGSGFVDGANLVSGSLPTVAHPQQIILADFQGTGKPDMFIADHGYDASPFPGHQQKLAEWGSDGKLHDVSSTSLPQQLTFTHRAATGTLMATVRLTCSTPIFRGPSRPLSPSFSSTTAKAILLSISRRCRLQ